MLASLAEIGVYCLLSGLSTGGSAGIRGYHPEYGEIVYSKSCKFGPEIVRNAVHSVFLNILTLGTPFPCIPAAFQQ